MTAPTVIDVTITPDDSPDFFVVRPVWSGVDRPEGVGYVLRGKALADRMARAMRAGVVFRDPTVATDVHGKSYVAARSQVLARMANADLRRLGY